ncbi:hypothetical protein Cabys_1219 [Caldithrix abyssi DSM 13497]|uniref:Uncharacterized protein n=1 Tax=Caldithrix abyssi DSM 13497 TaxID=880073 RepID=A0A1J1C7T1_CALAY|nr:hypothetical protein Cabys_1219 [Caldithrix abyssi DSM 13497]
MRAIVNFSLFFAKYLFDVAFETLSFYGRRQMNQRRKGLKGVKMKTPACAGV